jgi:endoglucanase
MDKGLIPLLKISNSVFVNQAGYPLKGPKVFTAAEAGEFELVEAESGGTLFEGVMSPLKEDRASGLVVAKGDFSGFEEAGRFFLRMKESGAVSPEFAVGERPYAALEKALLKCFYFQRCGMELTAEYAGPWSHGACHLAEAHVHGNPEEQYPQAGGWHDAGDYGKYTVAAVKAVADLLLAYERFPGAFAEPVGIPNASRLPDVLAEVQFELEFLLLMQRPDGEVYHKVTTAEFPPYDCMPELDLAELIFSPVSDTATGSFAAGMALAARVYREPNGHGGACRGDLRRRASAIPSALSRGNTGTRAVPTRSIGRRLSCSGLRAKRSICRRRRRSWRKAGRAGPPSVATLSCTGWAGPIPPGMAR